MFAISHFIQLILFTLSFTVAVNAQEPAAQPTPHESTATIEANEKTVGLLSNGWGGTDLAMLRDLAAVFDTSDNLRLVPIVGRGSVQNIKDILYLKGVDIGVVQSDTLNYVKDVQIFPNVDKRIAYIIKLFNLELHFVAAPEIKTIQDLSGQKVNVGVRGSGAVITASAVFRAFGLEVEPTYYDDALAIEKVRSGEIAAAAIVAGKPDALISRIPRASGLHLLPVSYVKPLRKAYVPAVFTHQDYPELVQIGTSVTSISVDSVLAVYNWSPIRSEYRYKKVLRFVDAFMKRYKTLFQPPHHPKWKELNIAAVVPG